MEEDVPPATTASEETDGGDLGTVVVTGDSAETKVIYHIDEEDTPYLVKIPKPGDSVRLCDFKSVLPSHLQKYKYFFKSKDDDFGVVKEEIIDEQSLLPLFNGRVVAWLVAAEGSVVGAASGRNDSGSSVILPFGLERSSGVGQTRPPSFHGGKSQQNGRGGRRDLIQGLSDASVTNTETDSLLSSRQDGEDLYDDTESSITSVSQIVRGTRPSESHRIHGRSHRPPRLPGPGIQGPSGGSASVVGVQRATTETSSMVSSEIESSLYDDTEDVQSIASSRFTTSTDHTSVSRNVINLRHRQKKRSRRKVPTHLARAGSISSVTDSTMSLNVITVTLNMDTVNFLGISIVGQSNKFGDGDCGIYVGSIMKGGAVALDGRIEPGDMILQVNETNFENMSNDDAVRVLREVVQKPGPIKLVVAKCWDPSPSQGYLSMPRTEPVRPIDPGAWVAHTAAVRGDYLGRAPSVTTLSASSLVSSQPETERYFPLHLTQHGNLTGNQTQIEPSTNARPEAAELLNLPLTTNSGMLAIVHAMRKPDSGLEVRDRMWLKIKIPDAFLGSDVVDWLFDKVEGFQDRRDARKYATQMLKAGMVKHTVNKTTFSEQCYYAFGDEASLQMSKLNLNDSRESGEAQTSNAPMMPVQPPMVSDGSGGSDATGCLHPSGPGGFAMPWVGPTSGGGSNTTYGPIYNPAAPPPSANYSMPPPYSGYPNVDYPQRTVSSSGSSHRSCANNFGHLQLAGSGSGSESASDRGCIPQELGNRGVPVLRNVLPPVIGNSSGGGPQ